MQKFYKYARIAAFVIIGLEVILFLLIFLGNKLLGPNYFTYGAIIEALMWGSICGLFAYLLHLSSKKSIVRTASILIVVGSSLYLINCFVLYMAVSIGHLWYPDIWSLILFSVGTIMFAIGIIQLISLYKKNSLTRISGLIFVSLVSILFVFSFYSLFEPLLLEPMGALTLGLLQLCFVPFLFGLSQHK